ncbi:MAG: ArsR/SmtB family transcription factor [Eubacteriales bacterium]
MDNEKIPTSPLCNADDFPDEDTLCDLAELFKMFGDSTRCKILYALSAGEMSVGDIADALSMTQSAISHQLRVLRSSRLVRCRRDGKAMLYALADDHVRTILEMGMDHIME